MIDRRLSDADRYMQLAKDAHSAADQVSDFASKNEMRQVARGYEQLALLAYQKLPHAQK